MRKPNTPTRRHFLASSAAATTMLTTALSVTRSAHAAGSERFNVALVGAGGRGTGAAADCLRAAKHIKLVTIADAFEDQARLSRDALQTMFGDQIDVPEERLFVGLDAYQHALACDVDLMIHGTPPGFRPLHFREASRPHDPLGRRKRTSRRRRPGQCLGREAVSRSVEADALTF